jgi:oligoribonuclease NrnB/cAMP/cGMP phosphodiesterase (DHH superfamily)
MKCFYHSADLDGHCSGALVKNAFPDINCELIPFNYGDEFPWDGIANQVVFMVDCSLNIESMVALNAICELHWVDHHKTIIDDAEKADVQIQGIREVGRAGCELVWEYLFSGANNEKPMPKSVYYLGRYDVWDHSNNPDTLPFQYGMRLHETHPNVPDNMRLWEELFKDNRLIREIVKAGRTVVQYEIIQNKKKCASMAFESMLLTPGAAFDAICCNLGMVNSQLFDSIWDETKYDMMVAYCRRRGVWNVSLYTTRDDIDCGKVAQGFGGGGHAKAAGFSCDELPLTGW